MLFKQDILEGIAEGRVTLAFRRWRKALPADGSTLLTAIGVISLDRVTVVEEGDITSADVRRTGMSVEALRAAIAGDGTLLRIELRRAGDDPRIALRDRKPTRDELQEVRARLVRLHGSAPWTARYLEVIAAHPASVSHRLAPLVGERDLARFKRRVRQLKALGLTESLEVGYRLSPRGGAVLSSLA